MGLIESRYECSRIDVLTDDDLLKIFSYLNLREKVLFRRVCRRWAQLLKDPSIWKCIDITVLYKRLADKYLWTGESLENQQRLKEREAAALNFLQTYAGYSTRYINLGELVNNEILFYLRESCPNLSCIKLTKLISKHPNIKLTLLPCNLKVICLRLVCFREVRDRNISKKLFWVRNSSRITPFAAEPFPYLQKLCLDGATISSDLCKQLIESKELDSLKLQSCVFPTSVRKDFETLTTRLRNVKVIDLAFCRFYTKSVFDVVLRSIAANFCHLESCGLHCFQPSIHVDLDEFLNFVSPTGSLKRLHLSGLQGITPGVLNKFMKRNQNIEILHLRFCNVVNDETLRSVVTNLLYLKELKLSGCKDITKNGFRQIANLSSLQVLDIAEMIVALEAILYVIRSLPCIRHVILSTNVYRVCTKVLRKELPKLLISIARLDYQEYLEHFKNSTL
ncbi:F-box/LRR-repeat protein 12-like [Amphiura filiformis]|uniref:F-box/LRR-repeat protein 12-like n=1 Tax=Amphiura filiformis TaxID=82378 RepID=UPI003B211A4A